MSPTLDDPIRSLSERVGAKALLGGAIAALVAAVALANAIVRSEADSQPRLAPKFWPGHPLTLRSVAMAEVGQAAARGEVPAPATMERLERLAARAPLEPEPFLVEAALALKAGDAARGQRLLIAAQRDPRSAAARYVLADLLIGSGDIAGGLREFTVLSRIAPGADEQLVTALAAYARTPGAIPQLRQLLRQNPHLRPALLSTLSSDASNADLALALALPVEANDAGRWQGRLLKTLVNAGMYSKAYQVWVQLTGANGQSPGIFRPNFSLTPEPPPFNWTFAQSGGGIAEPSGNGGLRVLHYGRKDTMLATQLMLLPAGPYELAFGVSGDVGSDGQLRWRVACLPSRQKLLDLPLTRAGAGGLRGRFVVPAAGCEAQRIELFGGPTEGSRSSDTIVNQLQLRRVSE